MLLSQSSLSLIHLLLLAHKLQPEPDPLFCHGSEAVSSLIFNVCVAEIGKTHPSKSRAKTVDKKITEALSQGHLLMMKLRMML